MKKQPSIKGEIFKFNLFMILGLLLFVTVTFDITISIYLKGQVENQLKATAFNTSNSFIKTTQNVSLNRRDEFEESIIDAKIQERNVALVDAPDFLFLDENYQVINFSAEEVNNSDATDLELSIVTKTLEAYNQTNSDLINFTLDGEKYAAIMLDLSRDEFMIGNVHVENDSFTILRSSQAEAGSDLRLPRYIISYASLKDVTSIQNSINIILIIIFLVASIIVLVFASYMSNRISTPISRFSNHIKSISERDFGKEIDIEVDGELIELRNYINIMSRKLDKYDQSQKNFLQNASHEFRTPLMSIQCYAEGLKHKVVDEEKAVDVILSETNRLTLLVKDLLYLSRLDTIEETYHFDKYNLKEVIYSCLDSMSIIATKYDKRIIENLPDKEIMIHADVENLTRALTNIISNCIRYASETIHLKVSMLDTNNAEIVIYDDGKGFDEKDLGNLFKRFYKGNGGNHGLGLSIAQNIIEKHKGEITACNNEYGAEFTIILPIIQT